jgi:hypothetical protein
MKLTSINKSTVPSLTAKANARGFILPLAMLICTIVLIISSGITVILAKEVYFSRLSRQGQLAYYAADNGVMCSLMIDDKYVDPDTGYGIFPYDQLTQADPNQAISDTLTKVNINRQVKNLSSLVLNDITCAASPIFDVALTGFAVTNFDRVNSLGATERGYSSSFSMRMNLGEDTYRCASITINKTSNYRQIISRGYASCYGGQTQTIERAVVSTTDSL